ncbi:hypothetical protein D9C73_008769 [Collichthys lucidus]|uniref:Uncharacterized protein n=1 Tax=Collichthys lucidus TaxID=240159 RepID=A0A4U5UIS1_COLLU|nr:hypothetical protein D9C73_008769 [Collichthys lucidus]
MFSGVNQQQTRNTTQNNTFHHMGGQQTANPVTSASVPCLASHRRLCLVQRSARVSLLQAY